MDHMDAKILRSALLELDKLKQRKDSFSSWLYGNDTDQARYQKIKDEIEKAFPGMQVVYADVLTHMTHVLVPDPE
jgi:hypothetical protein